MSLSPNLSLPYLLQNQAQKHVTYNEALRTLDTITQIVVQNRSRTGPAPSPTEGESYIPAAGASGDWQNWTGNIVTFQDGAWISYSPRPGWLAYILEENQLAVFTGQDWISIVNHLPHLGVNAQADSLNKFALKSGASLLTMKGLAIN